MLVTAGANVLTSKVSYSLFAVPPLDSASHRDCNECGTDSQSNIVHAVIPDCLR